ncbi:MAG: hypothetical protein COA91_06180 [Robiginitomaculum sp.]|nr:MAG: hypothetical protein COA91_06180 [Robiginitomaculum sp.]
MTSFNLEPINVASIEFAIIILAVMVVRQLFGSRSLPYSLGFMGLLVAVSWLDAKSAGVLLAALVPHYFICRAIWGKPEKISKAALLTAIGWQVLVLTSTKMAGLSQSWGIYGVIGLSYMTFRQIHLLLEAPRAKDEFHFIHWFSFIINPLTLVAGPIQTWREHTSQFSNQTSSDGKARKRDFLSAGHMITLGLIKITILAPIFAGQDDFAGLAASGGDWVDWVISYYSYYIFLFLDFSGYIDVVLGCGILCGYTLPANFNRPYLATNFQDFWMRWNITLGTWFRAHVFTPTLIALQRSGRFAKPDHTIIVALVLIFILIGIWHGLAWHFVLFGVIHAIGVTISHIQGRRKLKLKKAGKLRELTGVTAIVAKGSQIFIFQTIIAGTFILLNNEVSLVWRALFNG